MSSTTAENLRKFHSRQLHRVISTIKAEVDRAAETISQASESALTQITTRHDEYVTDLTIRQNEYVNGTFASLEQTSRIVENRLRNENRTIMEQVKAQLDKQIGVIFTERDNIYGHLSEQLNEQQWKLGEIGSHYKELNQQLTEEHLELRETIDHDKQQVEERQRLWEQTQLDQINELISQLHEYEEGHSNRINRLRSQFQERVVWQMNQLEWRMEEKMQQHNTTLTIAFQEFQEHVAKQLVDMADKNTNSLKPAIHTNSDRGIARFTFPTSTFQLGYPSYRYIMKANKPTIRYGHTYTNMTHLADRSQICFCGTIVGVFPVYIHVQTCWDWCNRLGTKPLFDSPTLPGAVFPSATTNLCPVCTTNGSSTTTFSPQSYLPRSTFPHASATANDSIPG
ncbi:hypothetical protein L211DRAFT_871550 [Terfezia boudieri ATCC MYA-4762]|uniref:Uncharacterized protein n=1 Tax=Terfezia boudieri ATCC MYA-4762 TaxID=1051890 RepID=A0A3N4L7S4_9PEZI|nr:hypothetical protein L211DRAFT_871550 [Terfezia boudieri ATCC MYA-4762]